MVFCESLGKGVIVGDKDKRAVSEAAIGEDVKQPNNTGIDYVLPTLYRTYSNLAGKTEA